MEPRPDPEPVAVGSIVFGAARGPLPVIAGPCVLEDREHTLRHAERIAAICRRLEIPLIFKSSFDKANRTSLTSYRGPGLDTGLAWLADVKNATGLAILTDIHEPAQAGPAAEVCGMLQIPAFLCRQTDLLVAAAETGAAVNIKKGQFLSPSEARHPLQKVRASGNPKVTITERGTSFGYQNLVVDFAGIVKMREFRAPVIYDATHSVQRPGAGGDTTSGDRTLVGPLARAAVAVGVDGLFLECHEDPDNAPSDGPNMVPLTELEGLLESLRRLM